MESSAVLGAGAETVVTERETEREREHCYAVWRRNSCGLI